MFHHNKEDTLNLNTLEKYHSTKILLLFYVLIFCISYFMLVSPGKTYTEVWYSDVMALLDATYRVSVGQIPGKDFHSSIGPINFYLSSIGLVTGYAPGVTFAIGAIFALFLIISPGLLMMQRRFSLIVILLSSFFIWLLVVVPLPVGEQIGNLTWGMFYNRHGWAALFLILLFYVEPRELTNKGKWLDGILLAILVLFELYCKITYGLVAVSFLFANMFISKYNRHVSLIALLTVIVSVIIVELALDIHQGYINSIVGEINNRGPYRGSLGSLVITILEHASTIAIIFIAMFYCIISGRNKLFDWLFVIGSTSVCIILLDQNGGVRGIPALVAVIVCLGELVRRYKITEKTVEHSNTLAPSSLVFLILLTIFIAEPVSKRLFSLYSQYVKSTKLKHLPDAPTKLSTFLVPPPEKTFVSDLFEQENANSVQKTRAAIGHTLNSYEYYLTIKDGAELLNANSNIVDEVFVLDITNPFLFTLDLIPQDGGYPFKWKWPSESQEKIFKDIVYVMEPRLPYQTFRSDVFIPKYTAYLEKNYDIIASSRYWQLWQKNHQ